MSLISLAKLKSFIHMTESHDDTLLQTIIDGTIGSVEKEIEQVIRAETISEYHDGNRDNTILLNNGLVTAVTHVKIDTVAMTATDYVWYAWGEINRIGGYFARGFKNIEVNYTHGYSSTTVVATNLPTTVGFNVYKDRPSKVCDGNYSGLAVIVLNSAAGGAGITYAVGVDYAVMELTGEVVALEAGAMVDGALAYIESGTYTEYSNLPYDLEIALLKIMSNTYHASLTIMEIEGSPKKYSQTEIDNVIGKYTRLAI